jgi:hypothetical protein
MATVNKDFKIKSGLIVEGTTGTINGYDILTKKQGDQDYIVGLIGGTSTSSNTPDTVVKRDGNGDFAAGTITADLIGNVDGQVSSLSNHDTGDLSEGSNLYFTNERAVSAQYGLWDSAGSASTAQNNAEDYADTVAGTAEQNAKNYADGLAGNYDANGSAATAQQNAENYTDQVISNLDLSNTYDAKGAASQALSDANTYTDTAVSNLVDSAPELLNTLNELAAAIANNPNYATDIASMISGKQDTLSAGNGIKISGTTVEIDNNYTATKTYVDGLASNYDPAGSASTAQQNAENYADSLAGNYDANGSASTAQQNAENYTDSAINALTTDDIEEGSSNLYFTDGRAKTSAADLLTSANLTNITITGTGSGLTITAENGVADSTTDDLEEGSTNLYFTQNRVIEAVDNQDITPKSVTIDSFRKEEATQQYVGSASTVDVHSFGYPYESAKYLVRVVGWNGGIKHSQLTEILVTVDGNDNIAITEYGTICTDTANLASFSARLDQTGSTRYVLTATTAVSGCEIIAAATMLSWAD